MPRLSFELPQNLPPDVCTEISKRACYCDGTITGSRVNSDSQVLEIDHGTHGDSDDITDKVNRLIDKMKSDRLAVKPRTLFERKRDTERFDPNVIDRLQSSGGIAQEGVGVVSRGGEFLDILGRFDALFERAGRGLFGASARDYNTLIPSEWLRRAGYFSSFAHSLTFAAHLREDYDILEQFAERHKGGSDLAFESGDELAVPEYCLSPAICYHTYGGLKDSQLTEDDGGLKVITAAGRCFRYESKNITSLDRLWEFSMREIVFVGEKERVLESREKALNMIWRLVEILDLTASVQTASDPFFSSEFKSLRHFQLTNELKYELLLPVSSERDIAAASFNYHESFFGNKFNIKTDRGEEVHTGCAAFGLERLVYTCLVQLGAETTLARIEQAEHELLTRNQ